MADEQPTEAAAQEAAGNEQQFALKRIYVKDLSFEVPNGAESFAGASDWQPKMNLDLNTGTKQLDEQHYEVALRITLTATHEEKTAYVAEVQQAGVFMCANFGENLHQLLGSVCPGILFPYAREAIDNMVTRGSFPALMLAPINFDAFYQQAMEKARAEGAAGGEEATH
ncbi:MAG: protein-export chaperone SecB [Pseudomonadales bacterium]